MGHAQGKLLGHNIHSYERVPPARHISVKISSKCRVRRYIDQLEDEGRQSMAAEEGRAFFIQSPDTRSPRLPLLQKPPLSTPQGDETIDSAQARDKTQSSVGNLPSPWSLQPANLSASDSTLPLSAFAELSSVHQYMIESEPVYPELMSISTRTKPELRIITTRPPLNAEDDTTSYSPGIDIADVRQHASSSRTSTRLPTDYAFFPRPTRRGVAITRICNACDETKALEHFAPPTATCKHVGWTCRECLASWISASIENNGWRSIRCPDCTEEFGHTDVKSHAKPEVFERFDMLIIRDAVNGMPEFRWCLSQSCKSGQIHDSGADDPLFTCSACGFKVCVIHECIWHAGETCEEYSIRTNHFKESDEKDKASRVEIMKVSKACSGRNCNWRIQKNEGCDHMTCSQCKHEFCWLCLADYKPIRRSGNHYHKDTCIYYCPIP